MRLQMALYAAVFALVPVFATAETVMLYTHEAEDSEFFARVGIDYAAAIEDGVLDIFFEDGYIIFTYGLPTIDPESMPSVSEPVAVRVAKSGGASLLLELEISKPVPDRLFPETVRFVFRNIILEEEIAAGEVAVTDVMRRDLTDPRALCVAMGRAVAKSALGG
jgi:hypothetical protein